MSKYKKDKGAKPQSVTGNVLIILAQLLSIAGGILLISWYLYTEFNSVKTAIHDLDTNLRKEINDKNEAVKTAIHHLDLKYEARMTKTETQMEERNNTANK